MKYKLNLWGNRIEKKSNVFLSPLDGAERSPSGEVIKNTINNYRGEMNRLKTLIG